MSTQKRLVRSFGALLLGPVVTFGTQVVNVPVMLAYWGSQLYGEWLIVSAIPTYILLTDMGFGNVAGTDMTMRVHRGDREGAIETFHSIIALVFITSSLIGALACLVCLTLPIQKVLHLSSMSEREARLTLLLLCLNCLIILQWSVLGAGYRSSGEYARCMFYVNLIRAVESASFFIVVSTHARPVELAAVMLSVSFVGTVWLFTALRRLAPDLQVGVTKASLQRVRELFLPAFAYMAFPVGSAFTTQGTTLAVGLILGPQAVALFNPMRTLARTAFQLTDAVKNAVWNELSAAYGQGDWGLARRLHRSACQVSLVMSGLALPVLAGAGPTVFRYWTHGRVSFDHAAFNVLLLSVLANSVWNASSAVALSANSHGRMSIVYLVATAGSLGLVVALLPRLGLTGASTAMLVGDLVMGIYVIRMSNRLLGEEWRAFGRAMVDGAQLRSILVKTRVD